MRKFFYLILIFCCFKCFSNSDITGKNKSAKYYIFSKTKLLFNVLKLNDEGKYLQVRRASNTLFIDSGYYEIKQHKIIFNSLNDIVFPSRIASFDYYINGSGMYKSYLDMLAGKKKVGIFSMDTALESQIRNAHIDNKKCKIPISTFRPFDYIKQFSIAYCEKYSSGYEKLLLSDYCGPDCYFSFVNGVPVSKNVDTSKSRILMELNTIIHESTHHYNRNDTFFITPDISIKVKQDHFFQSSKIIKLLPNDAPEKILRFKTYLSPNTDVSSNSEGIKGLLNEFTAYQAGTSACTSIAEKLISLGKYEEAEENLSSSYGYVASYYEFKLFMLCYVEYARLYNPQMFLELMNNKNLRVSFTLNCLQFEKTISKMMELSKLKQIDNMVEFNMYYMSEDTKYPTDLLKKFQSIYDKFSVKGITAENYHQFLNRSDILND